MSILTKHRYSARVGNITNFKKQEMQEKQLNKSRVTNNTKLSYKNILCKYSRSSFAYIAHSKCKVMKGSDVVV